MRRSTPLIAAAAVVAAGVTAASASIVQKPKQGELSVIALVGGTAGAQTLQNVDSFKPQTPRSTRAVTGTTAGDVLLGVDFRPSTGELIGLARNGTALRTYGIDYQTGTATLKGTLTSTGTANGGAAAGQPVVADPAAVYSIDVNPTSPGGSTVATDQRGALRIVSSTGQNLRVANIDAPATTTDAPINVGTAATVAGVQGVGYTNSEPKANLSTGTLLYDINVATDSLHLQNPANAGDVSTVVGKLDVQAGGTPVDITSAAFDVYPYYAGGRAVSNVGVAVLGSSTGKILARVDLTSGLAVSQGPVSADIVDIAALYPQKYQG